MFMQISGVIAGEMAKHAFQTLLGTDTLIKWIV